jgi:hypothetical protein
LECFLQDQRTPVKNAASQARKMDPKLYLLFALYSTIVASASHKNLREYIGKGRFSRLFKGRVASQA